MAALKQKNGWRKEFNACFRHKADPGISARLDAKLSACFRGDARCAEVFPKVPLEIRATRQEKSKRRGERVSEQYPEFCFE